MIEEGADISAPQSFRHCVQTALPDFLWMFDEIFRENAKNCHFLMQNVQTDNDFW